MKILEDIKSGKREYDFIEIMACPDGCVGGGGQPIPLLESDIRARIKHVYEIDKNETLNAAHKNSSVRKMYEELARAPWSKESKLLLHTKHEEIKVLK